MDSIVDILFIQDKQHILRLKMESIRYLRQILISMESQNNWALIKEHHTLLKFRTLTRLQNIPSFDLYFSFYQSKDQSRLVMNPMKKLW